MPFLLLDKASEKIFSSRFTSERRKEIKSLKKRKMKGKNNRFNYDGTAWIRIHEDSKNWFFDGSWYIKCPCQPNSHLYLYVRHCFGLLLNIMKGYRYPCTGNLFFSEEPQPDRKFVIKAWIAKEFSVVPGTYWISFYRRYKNVFVVVLIAEHFE